MGGVDVGEEDATEEEVGDDDDDDDDVDVDTTDSTTDEEEGIPVTIKGVFFLRAIMVVERMDTDVVCVCVCVCVCSIRHSSSMHAVLPVVGWMDLKRLKCFEYVCVCVCRREAFSFKQP